MLQAEGHPRLGIWWGAQFRGHLHGPQVLWVLVGQAVERTEGELGASGRLGKVLRHLEGFQAVKDPIFLEPQIG